jgi:hypothetical protein
VPASMRTDDVTMFYCCSWKRSLVQHPGPAPGCQFIAPDLRISNPEPFRTPQGSVPRGWASDLLQEAHLAAPCSLFAL